MAVSLVLTHLLSVAAGAMAGILLLRVLRAKGRRRVSLPSLLLGNGPQTRPAERTATTKAAQRAEEHSALRDQLSLATQTAGIGVWYMDIATGAITSDATLRQLLGIEQEIDPAMPLVHPDDRQRTQEVLQQAIHTEDDKVFPLRMRIQRPDGSVRHIQTHFRKSREAGTSRLMGVSWDITDEVERTEKQRTLSDRLNIATETAGICSWEFDRASQKFLWQENPIPDVSEVDPTDDDAWPRFRERIHPADLEVFQEQLHQAFRSDAERVSYRYRVRNMLDKQVHIQNHARLLRNESGEVVRLLGVSWDATREIEAAERLEEQARHERMLRDRLSISTEAAGICSWEVDLEAERFVMTDDMLLRLHRATRFDGTVAEFFSYVHPDDRTIIMDSVRQTLAADCDRFSCRYRVSASDNSLIHIQTHARLVCDPDGRGRRLLGVSWDITKEIEAAERLRQQAQMLRDAERRLERASLSSQEGHWELDLDTERVWFSSSYHALLGYRDGQLPRTQSAVEQGIHPDDLERARRDLGRHVTEGIPFNCDLRLRAKSGEYRWFRHRGTANRDDQGKVRSVSGSIQDIHEQKLAEDALRLVQQRFERAIKGTQDGLWELDADGSAWCSPRIGALLGYAPDELPSDTNFLRTFLHPEDEGRIAAATRLHFHEQGQPYDVEVRLRTRNGDYRWYRARATAERDEGGRPLRLSGSLQDVTEARAAREALLRATEAAESANRAKSEFLANVSHEIRTPMNGIIGMTGLLLDSSLDRTQRDYAETIRCSADSLLIVINDILDFSKIEAGKLDIESLEFDLRDTVEAVAVMLAFQAAGKNLELVVHIHPDVTERVVGDPQRLRQCLINLVGNAIKFTRVGEIVIEVTHVRRGDGTLLTRFEVRDTGIGIAAGTLQNLFQPFVQADSSTTRHFGGTGLGLSIVRRLVEMMGGEIGAHSEPGAGSSFWFTLPLAAATASAREPQIDLSRLGRRLLVVDDNETNRRVLAGQLMHAGYDVSLSSSGIEALSLMHQALADGQPFEVVLADHQMHDMDGATLGQRVNADEQLSRSRLVMLTSMDRHGDALRFASLGFAAYLTKPVRSRELLECINRVLAHDSKEWHMHSQPMVTRGALAANTPRYSGNVLLVEDNAVNQKVAVRFLERMGCTVRIADNGVEAVRAFGEARFDIVFMDLQMPVMDGLTATCRIRALEGGGTVPIIALTANAMAGQLERCMEAGMNGFLTKPLDIARLHETLAQHGLAARAGTTGSMHGDAAAAPVDLAKLGELTDGDPEFAHELATAFIASGEQAMEEMRAALAALDRPGLSRMGHKLKGASANIHAAKLRDLSHALELQASGLDQPRLKEIIEELATEFARTTQFLRQYAPAPAAVAS